MCPNISSGASWSGDSALTGNLIDEGLANLIVSSHGFHADTRTRVSNAGNSKTLLTFLQISNTYTAEVPFCEVGGGGQWAVG